MIDERNMHELLKELWDNVLEMKERPDEYDIYEGLKEIDRRLKAYDLYLKMAKGISKVNFKDSL